MGDWSISISAARRRMVISLVSKRRDAAWAPSAFLAAALKLIGECAGYW